MPLLLTLRRIYMRHLLSQACLGCVPSSFIPSSKQEQSLGSRPELARGWLRRLWSRAVSEKAEDLTLSWRAPLSFFGVGLGRSPFQSLHPLPSKVTGRVFTASTASLFPSHLYSVISPHSQERG